MQLIRDAWAGLDNLGRTALIVGVVVVLVAAMYFGLDLSWVPVWLGAG
jgi:hypothetical protein